MAQQAIPLRGTSQLHLGWLGLGVLLVVVALLAGAVGYFVAENRPNSDQALVDDASAAWSTPSDTATLAAIYASDATVFDTIANETFAGLPAIQARVASLSEFDFSTTPLTAPMRQGDFVAVFERHGTVSGGYAEGLVVYEVQDGKIVNQWVYPVE
jgi:hypothetical protein